MGAFTLRYLISNTNYKSFFNFFYRNHLKAKTNLNYADISFLDQEFFSFFKKRDSRSSDFSVINPYISVRLVSMSNWVEVLINSVDSDFVFSPKSLESLIDSKVFCDFEASNEEILSHIFDKFWL